MAIFDIFKKKAENEQVVSSEPENETVIEAGESTLDHSLEKTKTGFFSKLTKAIAGKATVDESFLDDLEEALVAADVGVQTTVKIIDRLEARVARDKYINTAELNRIMREEIISLLSEKARHELSCLSLFPHSPCRSCAGLSTLHLSAQQTLHTSPADLRDSRTLIYFSQP